MTRLDFYDTDQYETQTRWEYPYNDDVMFSYNCNRESPPMHVVRGKYNELFDKLALIRIDANDPIQPRLVWGYDA
jgi:hypothetical protein